LPLAALIAAAGVVLAGRLLQSDQPSLSAENPPAVNEPAPDLTVPAFRFRLAKVESVVTGATEEVGATARVSGREIQSMLSGLYRSAFLDPANWREGEYDEAWALFEPEAASRAEADIESLTLGSEAADAYERVAPVGGMIKVSLLMDEWGAPFTAAVAMRFTARASGTDGEVTLVVSRGEFFLSPSADGWLVHAYELERADRAPRGAAA
jgi:hypothetical protein